MIKLLPETKIRSSYPKPENFRPVPALLKCFNL